MKRAILAALAALAGCTSEPRVGCPSINMLAQRDAAADARAALAKNDRHLLMLGGFDGMVPAVRQPTDHPTRMLEGTADTATEECHRQRAIAEKYAAKYNEAILGAD